MGEYLAEFPDFRPQDMPAIPKGFVDTSWHNDACPSFTSDQYGLTIWVDYADPTKREYGDTHPRFIVNSQDHGVETSGPSLATDDWNEVLAFIEATVKERQEACHHRDTGRGVCADCGKFLEPTSKPPHVGNANEIAAYLHCALCLDERPADISPRDFAALEVGWTPRGLQIWCRRHDCNIAHIDFEGQTHPANTSRKNN